MADKTGDEILDGLYTILERATSDSNTADAPVPGRLRATSGDATPPDFPKNRPGRLAIDAANAGIPPGTVRLKSRRDRP